VEWAFVNQIEIRRGRNCGKRTRSALDFMTAEVEVSKSFEVWLSVFWDQVDSKLQLKFIMAI
jgi:hypothetical protein